VAHITSSNFTRVRVLLTHSPDDDVFNFEIEGQFRLPWHANLAKMAAESTESPYQGHHKSFTRLLAALKPYLESTVKKAVR
jgi:hypothetical protein